LYNYVEALESKLVMEMAQRLAHVTVGVECS
jgi:hypothetical protein